MEFSVVSDSHKKMSSLSASEFSQNTLAMSKGNTAEMMGNFEERNKNSLQQSH